MPVLPGSRISSTPHVRNAAVLHLGDFSAAEPRTQRPIKILSAPAVHLLVETTREVEPGPSHGNEAAADRWNEWRAITYHLEFMSNVK